MTVCIHLTNLTWIQTNCFVPVIILIYQTFETGINIIMPHEYITLIARAIYADFPTYSK